MSKLFGGGGRDDAADLFIQVSSALPVPGVPRVSLESDDDDDGAIECAEPACEGARFPDEAAYDAHYAARHTHECAPCRRPFASAFLLDLHLDERHSSLFAARAARGDHVWRCHDEACLASYPSEAARDDHLITEHGLAALSTATGDERRRKMARRVEKPGDSEQQQRKKKSAPPRVVQFGDEATRSFEGARRRNH